MMTWDAFPIPLMDKCIVLGGDGTKFSTFDAKADNGKRKLAKMIGVKRTLYSIIMFPSFQHAISIEKHPRDDSTNNRGPVDENQVVLGLCIFGRYRHIFVYARRTYRPCLMRVDDITRHGSEIEFEKCK